MWGSFVTALIIFLLTALAVFFFIVKPHNAFEARHAEVEDEAAGPTRLPFSPRSATRSHAGLSDGAHGLRLETSLCRVVSIWIAVELSVGIPDG